MPIRTLIAGLTVVALLLASCGSSEGNTDTTSATPPTTGNTSTATDPEEIPPADSPAPAGLDPAEEEEASPAHIAGPVTVTGSAEMVPDSTSAQYKVTLTGESGLPIVNWSFALEDGYGKTEVWISPTARPQQGAVSAMANVSRDGGTIHASGFVIDGEEVNHNFAVVIPIEGYIAPPPAEGHPADTGVADPFGDLMDDEIARTPFDTGQIISVVGRPTEPVHTYYISSSEEGEVFGVMTTAVLPTDSSLTFEHRFIAVSGWKSEMVAYCETRGNLSTVLFRQGQPSDYVRSGTVAVATDGRAESYEYVFEGDDPDSHPQPLYEYNLKTLGLLPTAMENLATRYHILSEHARFLVCTSDLSNGASVEERLLYQLTDSVELEVGGEAVEALVYRVHHTRVSNSDRVRSDSFGKVSEGVAYFYPDGRLIRIDGDGYTTRACSLDEAAKALGTTVEELLSPIDLDDID